MEKRVIVPLFGSGPFWIIAWLFTVGMVHLTGWKVFFALFIWPYYIGQIVAKLVGVGA